MMDKREPTLEELLSEPIIQQVMLSDGVRAEDVRRLMMQKAGLFAAPRAGHDGYPVMTHYPQLHTIGCTASVC